MIEIVSKRIREQEHWHKCPNCREYKLETNHVCGLSSGNHVFMCIACLKDHRLRLGTDMLIDIYLDRQQAARLEEVAPDSRARELDIRDHVRADVLNKAADLGIGPVIRAKPEKLHPEVSKKRKRERKEFILDTATRMRQDEAVHELEKIERKESFEAEPLPRKKKRR